MRNLLYIALFSCFVAYSLGAFSIFDKHGKIPFTKRHNFLFGKTKFCDNLGALTDKNVLKYLLCNKTAVKDQCNNKTAIDFYYATNRDNVSYAVRMAAKMFPDIHAVVHAAENLTYDLLECYRTEFQRLQNAIADGSMESSDFYYEWIKVCPEYQDVANSIVTAMNETEFPQPQLFMHTYPNLPWFVNGTLVNLLRNLARVWNNTIFTQSCPPNDGMCQNRYLYVPFDTFCYYVSNFNETDNQTIARDIEFLAPFVAYSGYTGSMYTFADSYCKLVRGWFAEINRNITFTDEQMEALVEDNLVMEDYINKNSILLYNDIMNRMIADNQTDDTSDEIATKVSWIIADWVSNATGNNNTEPESGSTTGNSSIPPDSFLAKVCNFLINGTISFPPFPGCAYSSSFTKMSDYTNQYIGRHLANKKNNGGGKGGSSHGGKGNSGKGSNSSKNKGNTGKGKYSSNNNNKNTGKNNNNKRSG